MEHEELHAVNEDGELLEDVIMTGILGRPLAANERVEHVNGNTLDCQRANLRLVTVPRYEVVRLVQIFPGDGFDVPAGWFSDDGETFASGVTPPPDDPTVRAVAWEVFDTVTGEPVESEWAIESESDANALCAELNAGGI